MISGCDRGDSGGEAESFGLHETHSWGG